MLIAHSLAGHPAVRFAADQGDLLRRLVIYAGSGIGPYRLPLRLMVIATRFSVRPTARNAERFDRFAVLDLDMTRERDPDWWDAFSRYTLSRAVVPHVKRTLRADQDLHEAGSRHRPPADRGPEGARVGQAGPHGSAEPRGGRERTLGLAAQRD
jgi:hypothetical protein